ncbi:MAG: M14 family zinc carboxypeptidase [Clostridia bacterium]|nr:M14 family zinc carboxypeptidase [Clostridia bacterium]
MAFQEILDGLLKGVPNYTRFYTVDELNQRAEELARRYPDVVELVELGASRNGTPIRSLKIGSGERVALMFGCPHPNEPIGAMMLDYVSERLAADADLRRELDYTWYIIKCIDPDGTKLNEGWFNGPFDVETYVRAFYRPPGYQQVEWTFPIDYKTLHFDQPLPETKCLMKIIDNEKPRFMYSLHNAGFGGAYWYITGDVPELYGRFHELAAKHAIPLALGEPEVPYCAQYAQAVFGLFGMKDTYDYYEKHSKAEDPASLISGGAGSDEYALTVSGTFSLVCELPYYFDPRIGDQSPTARSRRETFLERLDLSEKHWKHIGEILNRIDPEISDKSSPFYTAVYDNLKRIPAGIEAERNWAQTSEDLARPATQAETFDNLVISRFYDLLSMGMLLRLVRGELKRAGRNGETARLKEAENELDRAISRGCADLEKELNYRVVPIADLVRVQLGSGMLLAKHLLSC